MATLRKMGQRLDECMAQGCMSEKMQDARTASQKIMAQISSIRREMMQMGLFDEEDGYMSAEELAHAGELAKEMSKLLLKWSALAKGKKNEGVGEAMSWAGGRLEEAAVKRQGQILPSENQDGGFFAAVMVVAAGQNNKSVSVWADLVWRSAFSILVGEFQDVSSKAIREFLDSAKGQKFAEVALGTMPINMTVVQTITELRETARRAGWVETELRKFQGSAPTQAGTNLSLDKAKGLLDQAWTAFIESEAKKNWKEREAAMHAFMDAADTLLTSARAWFAQKR